MLTSLIMLKTKQWHDLLRLRILSWNQHVAICKPYSVTKSKHRDFYRIFKTKTKWQIKVLEHCRFMLWDKRPAKLSISLTVMHHIKFTHRYGGQRWGGGGGSNLWVFISMCTFKMMHVHFLDNWDSCPSVGELSTSVLNSRSLNIHVHVYYRRQSFHPYTRINQLLDLILTNIFEMYWCKLLHMNR